MGDAIVADVALTLESLLEQVPESSRAAPEPNPGPQEIPPADPLNSSTVHTALAEVLPEDAIVVLESPASTLALRNQLRLSRPGSYYFSAGGGLGFGLAASVGVQLAQPDRPVVCVLGEGSAQYAITAFWSAVAYDVPVTYLVLRNSEYAILKWFAEVEQVSDAPGLDLPALDVAAVAAGYGVSTRTASGRDDVREALADALASSSPELVEVPVEPGMSLF
jgi:benzoylformate decarboxylase